MFLRGDFFAVFLDLFLGGLFSKCLGVDGLFGDVGWAFEFDLVAVGIGERGDPKGVADERAAGCEVVCDGFVVDGDGVFALEADRHAFASLACGDFAGTVLLEHEGRSA